MSDTAIPTPKTPVPRPSSSVTLADVARVAGVTGMTVSRALHRPEQVRSDTRERVLEAVRLTGYVPNLLAGALASNKSRLVIFLLPTIATSIFTDTIQTLMALLERAGYHTLLGITGYSAAHEEVLVETLLGRRPDGVILTGVDHTDGTLNRLSKANVPIVEIWDLADRPLDMLVGFSHEDVGTAVARHLLGKGYQRFCVVSANDPRGMRRSRAVLNELAAHGVHDVPLHLRDAPGTLQSGREALKHLLALAEMESAKDTHTGADAGADPRLNTNKPLALPDVIVCSTDTLALGILAEAASRGLRVPEDVAVMGFGDLSHAAHAYPTLSTVRVDGVAIGKHAAEAILDRFKNGPVVSDVSLRIDAGFTIIERESA